MLPALSLLGGCRFLLGPDDARPPADSGADVDGFEGLAIDDALYPEAPAAAESGNPSPPSRVDCSLLLQDCASHLGCYPDEGFLGNTVCEPRGAGGPLSPCAQQADCDARLACLPSVDGDPASSVCVDLCRTGGDNSGCQSGLLCAALPAYPGVGYCRF